MERKESDEEYANALKQTEMQQIQRSESMTKARLEQENRAAKVRYDHSTKKKIEASRLIEVAKSQSAEAKSKIEYELALQNQRASQKIKEQTEKVCLLKLCIFMVRQKSNCHVKKSQ